LIAVKVGTEYSEWKSVNQGVCQGCSLFPLLFVKYKNDMISENGASVMQQYDHKWKLKLDALLFTND
jgi:hypothetical protein